MTTEAVIKRRSSEITLAAAVLLLLLPLLVIQAKVYLTLTIAGFAMGMLIFLVASGLSIIFGLLDVLNFAHGACFAWGAYVGFSTFNLLINWVLSESLLKNLSAFLLALLVAFVAVAILGVIIERVIVRRVYGQHLFQILILFGVTIVLEELIRIVWGPNDEVMPVPMNFAGNWDIMDIIVLRYPIIAILIGIAVFGLTQLILKKNQNRADRQGRG